MSRRLHLNYARIKGPIEIRLPGTLTEVEDHQPPKIVVRYVVGHRTEEQYTEVPHAANATRTELGLYGHVAMFERPLTVEDLKKPLRELIEEARQGIRETEGLDAKSDEVLPEPNTGEASNPDRMTDEGAMPHR